MTMNLTSVFNDVYNFGIVQSNASPAFSRQEEATKEGALSNKGTVLPLDGVMKTILGSRQAKVIVRWTCLWPFHPPSLIIFERICDSVRIFQVWTSKMDAFGTH